MIIWFYNLFYRVVHKKIHIFAFGQGFLGALEPHVTCSAATSFQPSQLHGFGLCLHDLTRVHIVSRSIQRAHRLVSLFWFFVCILFRGFHRLVGPFALCRLGGLVVFSGLFYVFVLVISFTLRVEYFLGIFLALTELDKLRDFLGWWI